MSEQARLSITQSLKEFFKTGVEYVNSGLENATDEVYDKRISTCKSCEHLTKTNQCDVCRCFVHIKAKIAIAECPLAKWGENKAEKNTGVRVRSGCCNKKGGS